MKHIVLCLWVAELTIDRPIGLIPLSSQVRLCVGTTRIGNLDL